MFANLFRLTHTHTLEQHLASRALLNLTLVTTINKPETEPKKNQKTTLKLWVSETKYATLKRRRSCLDNLGTQESRIQLI